MATPAYQAVAPSGADGSINSSLLSSNDYALMRMSTGAEVIFDTLSFNKGGIIDFLYKTGSIKDTTTRNIYHYEKGSIRGTGISTATGVLFSGTAGTAQAIYKIAVAPVINGAAATNGVYPYNTAGANPLQTPPGNGPTLAFGRVGQKIMARNGSLVGRIVSVNVDPTGTAAAGFIFVQSGSTKVTTWVNLVSGDFVYIVSSVFGQGDIDVPGTTQTLNKWNVTSQIIRGATPKVTNQSLSDELDYTLNGEKFTGPTYLKDMLDNFAKDEAGALLLGDGQSFVGGDIFDTQSQSETRTEVLGILAASETLGKNWTTLSISVPNLQAIAMYNLQNGGGNMLAVFGGIEVQSALSAFVLNPANGLVPNSSIKLQFTKNGEEVKGIDFDFTAAKVSNLTMWLGTANELNDPDVTAGPYNASTKTTVYTKRAVCFPTNTDMSMIGNPVLTSGAKTNSCVFGFNTYYHTQRNLNGSVFGTGRMQERDYNYTTFQAPKEMRVVEATLYQQYIAGIKMQSFSVS